jgi:hypothetical protein
MFQGQINVMYIFQADLAATDAKTTQKHRALVLGKTLVATRPE